MIPKSGNRFSGKDHAPALVAAEQPVRAELDARLQENAVVVGLPVHDLRQRGEPHDMINGAINRALPLASRLRRREANDSPLSSPRRRGPTYAAAKRCGRATIAETLVVMGPR